MVGAYLFSSSKAARKQAAANDQLPAEPGRCVAHMFVMHVAEELPTWPEGKERKRIWVSLDSLLNIMHRALRHTECQDAVKHGCVLPVDAFIVSRHTAQPTYKLMGHAADAESPLH